MALQRQIVAMESELETARRTIDQLVIECEAWECEAGYASEDGEEKMRRTSASPSRRQHRSIMSAMMKKKKKKKESKKKTMMMTTPAEVVSAPATPADASVKWRDNESVLKMAMMIEGADDVKTPVTNRVRPFLLEMTHMKDTDNEEEEEEEMRGGQASPSWKDMASAGNADGGDDDDDKDGSVSTIDSDILAESRVVIASLLGGADHASIEEEEDDEDDDIEKGEQVESVDPDILAESRVVINSLLGVDQKHDHISKQQSVGASPSPSSLSSPSKSPIALLDTTDDDYPICASDTSFAPQDLPHKDVEAIDAMNLSPSLRAYDDESTVSFGFCVAATVAAGLAVFMTVSPLLSMSSSSSSIFLHPS